MRITQFLSQTKTLRILFIITILLTLIFGGIMHFGHFAIIDEIYVEKDIRAHINAMTPDQRRLHVWLTATVDVAYPFAYGGFFIGMAVRYFRRFGPWLAVPSFLVIPTDLTEGFAQIMLLTGHDNYMGLKLFTTPLKLVLFIFGLSITAVATVIACKRGLKAR